MKKYYVVTTLMSTLCTTEDEVVARNQYLTAVFSGRRYVELKEVTEGPSGYYAQSLELYTR